MEINSSNRSYSPDFIHHQFIQLYELLDSAHGALKSLNPDEIGQGLATYCLETNRFQPRSKVLQNWHFVQQAVNVANPRATCTQFIAGLNAISQISSEILERSKFLFKNSEISECGNVFKKIDKMKTVLNKAESCIKAINEQYKRLNKSEEKLKSIQETADRIFSNLKELQELAQQQKAERRPSASLQLQAGIHPDVRSIGKASEEAAASLVRQSALSKADLLKIRRDFLVGVVVPESLVEGCQADAGLRKLTNKEAVRTEANKQKLYDHAGPLPAQAGRVFWQPAAIAQNEDGLSVKEGAVVPTCLREEKHKESNHLPNFYFQIDPQDRHLCITCGGIDTQKKADEFIEGIRKGLEARGSLPGEMEPLRIVLHQVNSFSSDGELIHDQHRFSRYIEAKLRASLDPALLEKAGVYLPAEDMPIVAHLNTALNFASTLHIEEKQSHVQNLDGLAALVCWLKDSIQLRGPRFDFSSIDEKAASIHRLRNDIVKTKEAVSIAQREGKNNRSKELPGEQEKLRKLQEDLTELLKSTALEAYRICQGLENVRALPVDVLKAKICLTALSLVLAKQTDSASNLGIPAISRTAELELYFLLDMLLHPVTEINCKSGLDRTGYARALWDSLRTMHNNYIGPVDEREEIDKNTIKTHACQDLLNLILDQDALSKELNAIQSELIQEQHLALHLGDNLNSLPDLPAKAYRSLLIDAIEKKYRQDPSKAHKLFMALDYQDIVAHQLLSVAQPITQLSTGVLGLKYGHGENFTSSVGANPHPLKRLPMCVSTETGQVIRLYREDWTLISSENLWQDAFNPLKGRPSHKNFMTEAGKDLLQRNSFLRGA